MRLKKKYLAIIVAAMIVLTAVLASSIVGSVQGSRIAYVAVSADKDVFGMNENVTFKLLPLSQGIQFTVNGMNDGSGVQIVRIPDSIDPDSIINDPNMLSEVWIWGNDHPCPVVPIPQFNSTGEPLELSWNCTKSTYDRSTNELIWGKATAGYYLLNPRYYSWEYGHAVKFMLDRSSIFYYDGLNVRFDLTISYDHNESTIVADLTLPEGSSPLSGNLTSFVPYYGQGNMSSSYHNFSINMQPGEATSIRVVITNPSYSFLTTSMDVILQTSNGTYVFGFWKKSGSYNGSQESVYLVQY